MSLPPHFLDELTQLTTALHLGSDGLAAATAGLVGGLHHAVNGYAGVQLTVVHTGHPVVLALVEPGPVESVNTSLRLPLTLLSDSYEAGGRAVFYSRTRGALVDLAADLDYALRGPAGAAEGIELDLDLPAPATSGITGWSELTLIHRAAGHLIDQGHDPDGAHETLRAGALAAGLAVHLFAARLLDR